MAKRRTQPDAASKRTQEAIDKLRTYYELGTRAIQLSNATDGTYARGVITQLVEETGENKATVAKCKQFAEMYSPAEFKDLCKLRRPNGKPIGWGHVTKLLTVPKEDKKLRVKLQLQAATEGWTARQLNDHIQRKYESVSTGMGRRWNLPSSTEQALHQISQRSQQWLRWYDELENAEGIGGEKIDVDELRAKLVQLKDETSNAFSVHINAEPECPAKHVVAIVAACDEVGDIDYRIVASSEPDESKTDE